MNRIRFGAVARPMFFMFVFLSAAVAAFAGKPAAFGDGEELIYAVSYRAKMVPNTVVGRATLKCSVEREGGETFYKITANGRTLPFFRWFFDLNDTYVSRMDSVDLRPRSLDVNLYEGGYEFRARYDYDWQQDVMRSVYKNKRWKEERSKEQSLSDESFDAVALFYNLRQKDFGDYAVGQRHTLHLVLEDTVRTIGYSLLGRERIKIRGIGRFDALKFRCQIATTSAESFEDGSEFTLWISDDDNRIPLLIESPVRVGSVRAMLREYRGIRHPLAVKEK